MKEKEFRLVFESEVSRLLEFDENDDDGESRTHMTYKYDDRGLGVGERVIIIR